MIINLRTNHLDQTEINHIGYIYEWLRKYGEDNDYFCHQDLVNNEMEAKEIIEILIKNLHKYGHSQLGYQPYIKLDFDDQYDPFYDNDWNPSEKTIKLLTQ